MGSTEGLAALKIDRSRLQQRRIPWGWIITPLALVGFFLLARMVYLQVQGVEVKTAAAVRMPPGAATPGQAELTAAGYIVADRQSVLAFKGTGRLEKLLVTESQPVTAAQLLAKIDSHELDAQIAQAEAELAEATAEVARQKSELREVERLGKAAAQAAAEAVAAQEPVKTISAELRELKVTLEDARRKLERDRILVTKDAMAFSVVEDRQTEVRLAEARIATTEQRRTESEQRLKVTEAQAEVAKKAVDVAQTRTEAAIKVAEARVVSIDRRIGVLKAQKSEYEIKAPFDGVVTEKAAEVGEIVAPISIGGSMARGSIVTIAESASLQAEVDVAETYIKQVSPNQRAAIIVDAFPDKTLPGRVKRILPRANRSKATVQVRVEFIERDGLAILPEMGVRVRFLLPDAPTGAERGLVKDRILVPQTAVQTADGKSHVWVINEGKAQRREVTTGGTVNELIEITTGLNAGEKVAITGADKIRQDGQTVKVTE